MSETWDVLVVDDEAVVRDAIRRVLGSEGMRVAEAEDAEAALTHAALPVCRLVLCDLMLPRGSGIEIVRAIRQRRPTLPVVMITGYPTADNEARALEAGATDFLPKPFDAVELLELVRRALSLADAAGEERTS